MRNDQPFKRRGLVTPLLLALLVGSTACASSGSSGRPGDRNLLTHAELVETGEPDLQQAIQRLRPAWLRTRSCVRPSPQASTPPTRSFPTWSGCAAS